LTLHRVLWLTKGLGRGGAERLLVQMAARLDRSRYELDIAYLLPWKDAFVPELVAEGVVPVCLAARRTVEVGWVSRLRRLLAERDYDLVHTHSPVPAAAARVLARRRTRFVHTEHNVWARYRWPTYAVNAATYRRNDAVIAVSEGVAASISLPVWAGGSSIPPIETLHHGVDLERIRRGQPAREAARRALGIDPHVPLVGTVANFTPKKDHAGLIGAAERVRVDVPELKWLLVGSGPLEAEIRSEVERRGLTDSVELLGMRSDVLELLPALDVFVLGSRFEGLPISLLEAMAAGVACVATQVGGIPEAVDDDRTGRLVPPGNPTALADAVIRLLLDPARRAALAAAAASEVERHFSIEHAVHRTEALYESLLEAAGPTRPRAGEGRG
jgi:glycosyltransferase involved in cell wall biosynthesis